MSRYGHHGELRSILVRSLYDWWESKAGADIPDRRDLDPLNLKHLLPYMMISDVEHLPFRIRYRLVGTKIVGATGLDFTGQYLDALKPTDPDEPWMDDYHASYASRRPLLGVSTIHTKEGAKYVYEFGIMPLRAGKSSIDQFVSIEDYFDYRDIGQDLVPWKLKLDNKSDM